MFVVEFKEISNIANYSNCSQEGFMKYKIFPPEIPAFVKLAVLFFKVFIMLMKHVSQVM